MSHTDRATEFAIFCIENTAARLGKSGAEVYRELKGLDGILESSCINETLLQMKYARIVSLLADTLQVSQQRALDIFYNSDTYKYLSQRLYHLHNMSDAYLVDEIMLELQAKQ